MTICRQEKKKSEPAWLMTKRQTALADYNKISPPDRVSHLWRYSDPNDFIPASYSDDNIAEAEFQINYQPGAHILKTSTAVKSYEDLLKTKFGSLLSKAASKITVLNEAFWNSGVFIYVPKNLTDYAILVSALLKKPGSFYPVRNFIYLEEGAEVKITEQFLSQNADNSCINAITEIFLAKGSKLTYSIIQDYNSKIKQYYACKVSLSDHSGLYNNIVSVGGQNSKFDLNVDLDGEHSSVFINGVVLGSEKQLFDHHTSINHNASCTNSELDFKVVLKDKSRSAYTGNLFIRQDTVNCSASQENRNLLLSEFAKAESIPELEILTNDVKRCSHGVTVSHTDPNQIFYLTSRGLNLKEAENLIVQGFLESTLSKIPESSHSVKEQMVSRIKQKLGVENND